MNLRSLINHLEDYVRVELENKQAALRSIEAQENAIAANDPQAFEEALQVSREGCARDEVSAQRRKKLIAGLARHWQVPVGTLTLGGIARRLGEDGRKLDGLRLELRRLLAEVIKRNRRLSALIGMHRRINTDLMQIILGCDSSEGVENGGSLINAEA